MWCMFPGHLRKDFLLIAPPSLALQVMHVDMLPGSNVCARNADGLAVLKDVTAFGNISGWRICDR